MEENPETVLDTIVNAGAISDNEEKVLAKALDEHKRFKEFVATMHHLMAISHVAMDDDDFTTAIGAALKKADPDYYK